MGRIYSVRMSEVALVNGTATGTVVQLKCGTGSTFKVLRAWISQSSETSSRMQNLQIRRQSTGSTVTSFTPLLHDKGDAASNMVSSTSATGYNGTAEGTPGDVLIATDFNVLNGWLYVPVPEDRIVVGPTNPILSMFLPTVPTNTTFSAGFTVEEEGS